MSLVMMEQCEALNICPTSASDAVWLIQPLASRQCKVTGGHSGKC